MTTSPEEAARAILGDSADYAEEYSGVRERLVVESSRIAQRYPDHYVVEAGTAYLLYVLVRQARPSLIVEVGVADGLSTQIILSALDANGGGRLISVDVDPGVGGAAAGHPRWDLRIHSRGTSKQLHEMLVESGPPDLFFHDGSHRYYDQYGDYLAACESMQPGSIFASDDIDLSFAFIHLVNDFRLKPVVLMDRRKVVGVFRRP